MSDLRRTEDCQSARKEEPLHFTPTHRLEDQWEEEENLINFLCGTQK
jgi:hypothetical protein